MTTLRTSTSGTSIRRHAPYSLGAVKCDHSRTHVAVPPLPQKQGFLGTPSEQGYQEEVIGDDKTSRWTPINAYDWATEKKLEQIENCQLSLIALSEKDAFIEGFKIGVRMTTEIYADTQQRGWDVWSPPLFAFIGYSSYASKRLGAWIKTQHRRFVSTCDGNSDRWLQILCCVLFEKVLFLFSDGIILCQSPVNGYYGSLY